MTVMIITVGLYFLTGIFSDFSCDALAADKTRIIEIAIMQGNSKQTDEMRKNESEFHLFSTSLWAMEAGKMKGCSACHKIECLKEAFKLFPL